MSKNINTTISINAVDNTAAAFSKVEQGANKVYQNILKQSTSNLKIGQDTIKQIEKEIEAYKRKQQIQLESQKSLLRGELNKTYSPSAINERLQSIVVEKNLAMSKTTDVLERARIRKKYDSITNNYAQEQTELGKSESSNLEKNFKGFEEEQKNTNLLLKDMLESLKDDVFERVDRKNKSTIRQEAEEALKSKTLSDEEKAARMGAAKGSGSEDTEKQSLIKKLMGVATLLYIGNKVGQMGQYLASAQDSDHLTADFIKEIPLIGGAMGTAQGRHIDEALKRQRSYYNLKGITGYSSVGIGSSMAADLGVDGDDFINTAARVARAKRSNRNLNSETRGYLSAKEAFSLDEGSLNNSLSSNRFDVDNVTISKTVAMVASVLGSRSSILNDKVDLSKMEDLMSANNALIEDQLTVLENSDQRSTIGAMKAFSSIYSDPNRMKDRMLSINNALKNPGNDYQQARNFAILNQLNPNADYFTLLKEQNKGIYSKGFLSNSLKQIEGQFGGGSMGKLALMKQFGFSPDQAEKFMDGYKRDRTVFDNITEEGINNYLGNDDLKKLGGTRVSDLEKEQAVIRDAFGKGAFEGVSKVAEYIAEDIKTSWKKVSEAINSFGEDMVKHKKHHSDYTEEVVIYE